MRTDRSRGHDRRPAVPWLLALVAVLLLPACANAPWERGIGAPDGPFPPRSMVARSGARVTLSLEEVEAIHDWTLSQFETIHCRRIESYRPFRRPRRSGDGWMDEPFRGHESEAERIRYCTFGRTLRAGGSGRLGARPEAQDSTIHVDAVPVGSALYPWETLAILGDTVRFQVGTDTYDAFAIYAYLHLLEHQGRLERALPEVAGLEGYERERAIVERTADVWQLLRTSYVLDPNPLMDELVFAREDGHLDAFLFARRPEAFPEARERWLQENPHGLRDYGLWVEQTLAPSVSASDGG